MKRTPKTATAAPALRPLRSRKSHAHDYLYRRIADELRRRISSGAIAPGARLPSLNELAAAYGANRLTVHKAIEELRSAGLVFSVPAQGTFAAKRSAVAEATTERSLTIGVLSRVLAPSAFGLYHQAMISGLYDGLGAIGANLLVLAAGTERPADLPDIMRRANADAMIYMGAIEERLLARMLREGPPAVVLDHDAGTLPVDGIRVDNRAVGALAIRHLLACGCGASIAIVEGDPKDLSSARRLEGARTALRGAGVDPRRVRVVTGGYTRSGGREAAERLLASKKPLPRGLFFMNDEMAAGALVALRGAGLRVPEDLLIVGADDSLWARSSDPPLTTVRIDARHMGSQAVRLLLKRLATPDAPFVRMVLDPETMVRASAPLPAGIVP